MYKRQGSLHIGAVDPQAALFQILQRRRQIGYPGHRHIFQSAGRGLSHGIGAVSYTHLEAVGQEDHGQGEAPEASGPEAGGQEQQDEQAPPIENPLADGGEKEIAAEAPEKAEKDPEKAVESGQAHAPQQAEQEAETPQDKIETEEGGEAQNQQDLSLIHICGKPAFPPWESGRRCRSPSQKAGTASL